MYNDEGSPTVTNCTFSGNWADYGGGMYNCEGSPAVTNCTFSRNSTEGHGGGMYNEEGNPVLTNCMFSENSADGDGGGMYNDEGSPTVTGCTFSANSAGDDGGGMYNIYYSSPTLANCTFSGNSAGDLGGGMGNQLSSPTVVNCTFSGNSISGHGGGMGNLGCSNVTLTNCILWGNTAYSSGNEIYDDSSTPVISYCDIAGCLDGGSWDTSLGHDGGGNIDADPLFVDADGYDDISGTEDDNLRLQFGSPSIDAGDNTAVPAGVTTHLDGKPRFLDDPLTADTGNGTPPIVDMGAYEYQPSIIFVDADATGANNGSSWADAYKYFQNALADSAASGKDILVAEGIYKPDQTTANPGGTGSRTETFMLVSDVGVYGGFPSGGSDLADRDPNRYETILSGDLAGNDVGFTNNGENSYHVVTGSGTDPNAILDGFAITAGNADGSNPNNRGGGMYNDEGSTKLVNCNITNNSAGSDGGGMYIGSGNPTLVNCIFSGNGANMGGGLYTSASSSVTVVNCVFTANTGGNSGGGILSNGSLIVTNSVFYGNQVTQGMGGAISNWTDSALTLQNSILWSNLPDQIFVMAGSSAPMVSYSDVEGGYSGTGNIDDDPLFKDADGPDDIPGTEDDNLELATGSPCIDAGDNSSVPADTVDLDGDGNTSERMPLDLAGRSRFTDDPLTDDTGSGTPPIVEMGAYERYEFCGSEAYPYPPGDVTGPDGVRDCFLDFYDFAVWAAHWLEYTGPE